MPEIHLRQPRFTYSVCGPFTNNKIYLSKYVYQKELDKACFKFDMAYGNFKDLPRRTAADKVLDDKTFSVTKSPKYDGYQRCLASLVYI